MNYFLASPAERAELLAMDDLGGWAQQQLGHGVTVELGPADEAGCRMLGLSWGDSGVPVGVHSVGTLEQTIPVLRRLVERLAATKEPRQ